MSATKRAIICAVTLLHAAHIYNEWVISEFHETVNTFYHMFLLVKVPILHIFTKELLHVINLQNVLKWCWVSCGYRTNIYEEIKAGWPFMIHFFKQRRVQFEVVSIWKNMLLEKLPWWLLNLNMVATIGGKLLWL